MIDDRLAKRALMSWGVGRSYLDGEGPGGDPSEGTAGAAVAMVEAPEHVAEVLRSGVVRPGGALLIPAAAEQLESVSVALLPFEGEPSEPASELSVGDDVFVQVQDYATAEYMSVIGPTLLRILAHEDFDTFMGDIDRAAADGAVAQHLVHPASQLADRAALGAPPDPDGPSTRLHLRRDGTWAVGPLGEVLGSLGDDFATLDDAWRRATDAGTAGALLLARAVDEQERREALAARPWAGHALSVLAALQDLAARGVVSASVSGFGGRLGPALAEWPSVATSPWPTPSASAPVLAWTDDDAFVHLPESARTFRIGRDAAIAYEAVLLTGGREEASRFVAPSLADAAAEGLARAGATPQGIAA